MLPLATMKEIRRLLAEGRLAQRTIAAKLGVSRGTVSAVARGLRRMRGGRLTRRATDIFNPEVPPQRCPGCGGMVQMPCVLCRTRRYAEERRKREREAGKGTRRRVA